MTAGGGPRGGASALEHGSASLSRSCSSESLGIHVQGQLLPGILHGVCVTGPVPRSQRLAGNPSTNQETRFPGAEVTFPSELSTELHFRFYWEC